MNLKTRENSQQPVSDYSRYYLTTRQWCVCLLTGTAVYGIVIYTFYRSLFLFFLCLPIAGIYPFIRRRELALLRQQEFAREFKEGILILAASLSAGYSVENAFYASLGELKTLYGEDGLITREFEFMSKRIGMKCPVEQVLLDLADRSGLDEIENFAQVFAVAKRSGGQLVPVINHTAGIIREKMQVREEIETLNASRRFEQKIMNMIPFFIVFYINATSPGFFDMMYETSLGRIMMSVCLLVYVAAYWLSGKLLQIEV
ncbi:MAG: type II secretion system F family protein [Clostridiaceae bacterium]|nr:type II secretion system F family protein [Clostridiaceae bacterium]